MGCAQPAWFGAVPRIPAREVAEFKESDPTSLSLFVDLALLNRLVRSLPRNSLPDHPPTQPAQTHTHTHTHTQTNSQTDAESQISPCTATSPPAPRPPAPRIKRLTSHSGGQKKRLAPPHSDILYTTVSAMFLLFQRFQRARGRKGKKREDDRKERKEVLSSEKSEEANLQRTFRSRVLYQTPVDTV